MLANGRKRRALNDSIDDNYQASSSKVAHKNGHITFTMSMTNNQHNHNANIALKLASNSTTKKLTIRNLRKFDGADACAAVTLDAAWPTLRDAVIAVQHATPVASSLEQLYQSVVNLCTAGHAADLYNRLKELCQKHIDSLLPVLLDGRQSALSDTTHCPFLDLIHEQWQSHCRNMLMIRSIFLYMDRTYVLHSSAVLPLWDMGIEQFRSLIVDNVDICNKCVDDFVTLLDRERDAAGQVNTSALASISRMFIAMQCYEQVLESRVLAATDKYYEAESKRMMAEDEVNIAHYIRHVRQRLNEEAIRARRYLDETRTRRALIASVENHLIGTHIQTIINKGLPKMLDDDAHDDISLMFELVSAIQNGRVQFKNAFSDYIKRNGKVIVMNTEREKTMVVDLLAFRRRLDTIVAKCCGDDKARFTTAVKDAFDVFINQRQNKPAEMIAKYLDERMRAGNKEASDDEMDRSLDEVIQLFRFVHGKDVFEAFYKKDLAKRLLLGRSASVDAEKSMLSKLKAECGPSFTSKLEGMFRDIEMSREMQNGFKKYVANLDKQSTSDDPERVTKLSWPNVEMTTSVLTLGNWPPYPPSNVIQPPEMLEWQKAFTQYYTQRQAGRKLTWQSSLGQVTMKARFGTVEKELQLSLYQALVLLQFNDHDTLSYEEIARSTNIEESELKRTLQSLACGKVRPITKTPKGKDINEGDIFAYSTTINDPHYRIKISQVQMKETAQEHAMTEEQVYADRLYAIDAAVVRVMKGRKQLSHSLLISELLAQLRFPAKPSDLKKRIESLIERDYLSRDKDDSNLYHYVA